jgi:hypothetical protein
MGTSATNMPNHPMTITGIIALAWAGDVIRRTVPKITAPRRSFVQFLILPSLLPVLCLTAWAPFGAAGLKLAGSPHPTQRSETNKMIAVQLNYLEIERRSIYF